jgi:hypothetical protein
LKQLGFALAMEYLRNVGIRAAKPDRHIMRVLGPERLGYFTHSPSEKAAVQLVASLAASAGCNPTYLDNLLWLFCAKGYGQICGAVPRCEFCAFRQNCRYPALENFEWRKTTQHPAPVAKTESPMNFHRALMDAERTPLKVRQDRLGHVDGEEITFGIPTPKAMTNRP